MAKNELKKLFDFYSQKLGLHLSEKREASRTCVPKALSGVVGVDMPEALKRHRVRQLRSDSWIALRTGLQMLVQTRDVNAVGNAIFRDDFGESDLKNVYDLIRVSRRSNSDFGSRLRGFQVDPAQKYTPRQIGKLLDEGHGVVVLGRVESGDLHAAHIVKSSVAARFVDSQTGQGINIGSRHITAIVFRKKT